MNRSTPSRRSADQLPLADGIRATADQLAALTASSSQLFDALAFVLSRVADADRQIAAAEARRMEDVLTEHGRLNHAQAALVIEIAKHRKRIADAGRAYRESLQLRRRLDIADRARVLDVLYEVAAADGEVADCELDEILQVAAELGFTSEDVARCRCAGGG
jgi:uncharacterized tellurite resistance protein B-like protein